MPCHCNSTEGGNPNLQKQVRKANELIAEGVSDISSDTELCVFLAALEFCVSQAVEIFGVNEEVRQGLADAAREIALENGQAGHC